MAYQALEKVNWLKHMPESIKNIIPTSFILNTPEICTSLSPAQLLRKLQEEKTALENEDDIRIIKDGQSSKARIFAKWMHLSNLNEINNLIETGFIQTNTRHTISLHPMIQEIALSETKPSVSSCHTLLDSLQQICLMHGIEVDYYKKQFQRIGNIIELIQKDDMPKYLLFLENSFPYMQKYDYQKGMKALLQELKCLLKSKDIGTDSFLLQCLL